MKVNRWNNFHLNFTSDNRKLPLDRFLTTNLDLIIDNIEFPVDMTIDHTYRIYSDL